MKDLKLLLLICMTAAGTAFAAAQHSQYISKVYDFVPAPGQFVNDIPEYLEGDTKENIIAKVEENLCGDKMPGMISLGSYGGYVIFGFDHPVVNVKDEYDFKVYGNAFVANMDSGGGSCEPGIVMVSKDTNGNGLPDDEWYELAGSEYNKPTTKKNYKITYYKPADNKTMVPDPDNSSLIDIECVKWTTNYPDEAEGYVIKNSFHTQSYWPQWIDGNELVFEGTKLANNGVNNGTDAQPYWVLYFVDWGYVDNIPNANDPGFKIDWAVDKDGKPVHLSSIDFIKVYNSMNQSCGWLGETSTEVCGGEDLHPDAVDGIDSAVKNDNGFVVLEINDNNLFVRSEADGKAANIYSISGMLVQTAAISAGDNAVDISALSNGMYLLNIDGKSVKFVK